MNPVLLSHPELDQPRHIRHHQDLGLCNNHEEILRTYNTQRMLDSHNLQ